MVKNILMEPLILFANNYDIAQPMNSYRNIPKGFS